MSVQIIRGNALDLPLADNSVDLVVTSPPYFGLRSYQDGGEHYDGQLGSEPTPAEFVDALIAATREMVRVTKPCGSIFVNLGDKYASGGRGTYAPDTSSRRQVTTMRAQDDARPKSLLGIPWRYALRCIDDLGLILRAEVIWSKPNGLPESVTDRVRRSHEQWFHMTLQPRYFSAVDEIREAHNSTAWIGRDKQERANSDRNDGGKMANTANPLGKLPGSVWTIPTQPLTVPEHVGVDHFAAFPMELPRRIIRGWSPSGICEGCGEGRRPVTEQTDEAYAAERARVRARRAEQNTDREAALYPAGRTNTGGFSNISNGVVRPSYGITGYACGCPKCPACKSADEPCSYHWHNPQKPTHPAVVLDPFGGTGTTAIVAHALGRHGISVDMSADYCRLAQWRTSDRGQLAAAMQVDKPAPVMDGQADLFEEWTA